MHRVKTLPVKDLQGGSQIRRGEFHGVGTAHVRQVSGRAIDLAANPRLAQGALHTLEHLIATYARSSALSDRVIYFGPMGCRTGFYLILRDSVSREEAIALTRDAFAFAAAFTGEIPGAKAVECGNYLEHDLPGARTEAAGYVAVLQGWTAEKMVYPA